MGIHVKKVRQLNSPMPDVMKASVRRTSLYQFAQTGRANSFGSSLFLSI